jgi:hypothetical protein
MNHEKLIACVIDCCKKSVSRDFNLKSAGSHNNKFIYVIQGTSDAINRFDYPQESVKVLNWFDTFWLYIEFQFVLTNKKVGRTNNTEITTHISLSVFQEQDNEKYQLFRAEWDDYKDENQQHAQPHWHITSNQAIENAFEKYTDTFEKQEFIDLLQSEKQKVFDVKKIHFAMNGDWQNHNNHINKIDNEIQVANWLQGVLAHIRTELQYK